MPTVYLKDYKPSDFLIPNVHLRFDLDEEKSIITSTYKVTRANKKSNAPFVLNGGDCELLSIEVNGRLLDASEFVVEDKNLTLRDTPKNDFDLRIRTHVNPKNNTEFSGLYLTDNTLTTHCEAEGFRNMTYFLDRPDVLSVYTTEIHADKTNFPVLLASGKVIQSGTDENNPNRHYVVYADEDAKGERIAKPSYLFAMVAGNLALREDLFITRSGNPVKLRIYVPQADLSKTKHAMEALKAAMKFDEERYDREYDLPIYNIVGIPQFNAGAMENKGLNIFNNSSLLADLESTSDKSFEWVYSVVGHEYFHNWRGNRVTVKNWFQLSLKEGFATITEQEFAQTLFNSKVSRISDIKNLQLRQFTQDASPLAHAVMPDNYESTENLYTMTIYLKGAELLNMMKSMLGDETFKHGCSLYFANNDGEAANIEDFVAAMSQASGRDLSQFLLWYQQAGTPELEFDEDYNASTKTYRLTVKQSCPATPGQPTKKPMLIPIAVALLDQQGNEIPLKLEGESRAQGTTRTLELMSESQTFTFKNVNAKPVPSLLRDFSAPVKITRSPVQDKDNLFLLQYDKDPINRWFAAQNLAKSTILKIIEDVKQGKMSFIDATVIGAYRKILLDASIEPRLKAELLTFPAEETFFEYVKPLDPALIARARNRFLSTFANTCYHELVNCYNGSASKAETMQNQSQNGSVYDPNAGGMRMLRNTCLSLLMRSTSQEIVKLSQDQIAKAKVMTDTTGALLALGVCQHPVGMQARQQELEKFADKWKENELVLDYYFRITAMSTAPDTLDQVIRVSQSPYFNIEKPDLVLALLRVFAMSNPVAFHDPSGRGYRFLTDMIIAIDKKNGSSASGLVPAFADWAKLEPVRQEKMLEQLFRLSDAPDLSNSVKELVTKTLKGAERKVAEEEGAVISFQAANEKKRKSPTEVTQTLFSSATRMRLRSDDKRENAMEDDVAEQAVTVRAGK